MSKDVDSRGCITPKFDLHCVRGDATACPREQALSYAGVHAHSISTATLADCSDVEDDVVSTIYCNDWKEAVVGWRQAAPCVKYAWSEQKKHSVDGQGEAKKSKGIIKPPKHPIKEINWRCTIEPGTYRYSPGGFHRKIVDPVPSQQAVNSDERKLLIHLERVRDHFEKTLKCANKPMTFPSWKEGKNEVTSNSRQRSSSLDTVEPNTICDDAHSKRRRSRHKLTDEDPTPEESEEISSEFPVEQQESRSHNMQEYQVHKVQINDPFNGSSDDQVHQRPHRLRLSHFKDGHKLHQQGNKLTGWESSSSSALLNESSLRLGLNPLQKVTPQQRKLRDDHEVGELGPSWSFVHSATHSSQVATSHSTFEPSKGTSKDKQMYAIRPPAERYEQLCFRLDTDSVSDGNHSNLDTSSLYSHKEFSLAKELQSVQEILQAQRYLSQQAKAKPDRKRRKPHRLRALPPSSVRGVGDVSNSGDAGEPLHRGIIDRKTASDLATELLPGINGQGLALPLCSNRII